ncbi:MAG: hypothetical protein U0787_04800 [Polyangia bacterium]
MNLAFVHYNLRMTLTLWMIYTLLQCWFIFLPSTDLRRVLLMGCVLATFVLSTPKLRTGKASGNGESLRQGRTRESLSQSEPDRA